MAAARPQSKSHTKQYCSRNKRSGGGTAARLRLPFRDIELRIVCRHQAT